MRLPASFPFELDGPDAAGTSVVSAGVKSRFEQSEMCAGQALPLAVDFRVYGGSEVSDTAKAKSAKSTNFIYAP